MVSNSKLLGGPRRMLRCQDSSFTDQAFLALPALPFIVARAYLMYLNMMIFSLGIYDLLTIAIHSVAILFLRAISSFSSDSET